MATTKTYLNGAATTGATQVTLAAFTAPTVPPNGVKGLLRFVSGEFCLITDVTLAPTLGVVRGYYGSTAAAHTLYEGVEYGIPGDFASPVPLTIPQPVLRENTQSLTATGVTGTTAAAITVPPGAFIVTTGASGAAVNLPVPVPGDYYLVKNNSTTGDLLIYSVGATLNGVTGTTGVTVTTTGDKTVGFHCVTAGVWILGPVNT